MKIEKKELTLERLKEVLDYHPEWGIFIWKKPNTSRTEIGAIAGWSHSNDDGKAYVRIMVDGKRHLAHRLAWFYTHGKWPAKHIDHIDGNGKNNRLHNLRECTRFQNQHNAKIRHDNKTGVKGVAYDKNKGKFVAQIAFDGNNYHLGYFDTAEEARIIHDEAAIKHHGEFARTA